MEPTAFLGFIDAKTALLILHIGGVALGAGVAFFSAAMFMKVMYDGRVTKNELSFIELASAIVAVGLGILVASGIGLFLLDAEKYLASSKFLAKMTIVAVLVVNGSIIHAIHLPALQKHLGEFLPTVPGFGLRSVAMYAGGAVSMVSWASALVLGVFRSVPYEYEIIMLVYAALLMLGVLASIPLRMLTFSKVKN